VLRHHILKELKFLLKEEMILEGVVIGIELGLVEVHHMEDQERIENLVRAGTIDREKKITDQETIEILEEIIIKDMEEGVGE